MPRSRLTVPSALVLSTVLLAAGCGPQTVSDTRRDGFPPATPSSTDITPTLPASPTDPGPAPPAQPRGEPRGSVEVVDTVVTDLPIPWGLAELPDGTVLVSTRDEHHLYRVVPRVGTIVDLGEVPGVVSDGGEGGLLGVAVAHDFVTTKRIYLYYSTATDNRIAYVTLQPGSPASLSQPTPVFTGIPRGVRHNGGRIAFGPDGMLYVGTGDTEAPALAQYLDSLGGKILRMTPQGRPAPGNPFAGSVVYSYGHRDVQGLTFDAAGRLFASEPGATTADELNWIRPGRNYGWPDSPGATTRPGISNPVASITTDDDSPSGVALAGGAVYMAALQGERLWRITLDATRLVAEPRAFLVGELGRLRSIIALDPTTLLVSTSNTDGRVAPRPGDDRLVLLRVR